jgi:hypothetical protein
VSALALHLVQATIAYVLMIRIMLRDPRWQKKLTDEDQRGLSALGWTHVNLYGRFELDMSTHLDLDPGTPHDRPGSADGLDRPPLVRPCGVRRERGDRFLSSAEGGGDLFGGWAVVWVCCHAGHDGLLEFLERPRPGGAGIETTCRGDVLELRCTARFGVGVGDGCRPGPGPPQ